MSIATCKNCGRGSNDSWCQNCGHEEMYVDEVYPEEGGLMPTLKVRHRAYRDVPKSEWLPAVLAAAQMVKRSNPEKSNQLSNSPDSK